LKKRIRKHSHPVRQKDLSRTYLDALDELQGVVCEMDTETRTFTHVSTSATKLLGYAESEWLEPGFFDDHVHPDDREAIAAEIRGATDAARDLTSDFRMLHERGGTLWVGLHLHVPRKSNGRALASGTLVNISNLKFAESALRESEERYTQLAEASSECIIHHENGRILDVNPVCRKILGYTREEMIGRLGTDLSAPEDRERLARHIESGSDMPITGLALRKDGARIPVEVSGKNIHLDGKNARVAILRDITDRRRMEDELRRKELDYRTLMEEASDAIVLTSPDLRIIAVNRRACEMAQMCEADALGRPISDFLVAEDLRANPLRILDVPPGVRVTVERPMVSLDGTRALTEISAKKLADGRVLAIIRDITERRKTEDALRQAQTLIAAAFETSRDAVVLFRLSDDVVLDVNAAWERLTGVTKEEIVGRSQFELAVWADPSARKRYREKLARDHIVRDFEYSVLTRAGELRRVLISAEVVSLAGELVVLAVGHDVTDQLRLESELIQAQKLEAVGRFAGSIAHDFNNILTGILSFSELAASGLGAAEPAYSDVEQIRKAAKRAAKLTKQLLAFSRHQVQHQRTLSLNAVISDVEPMLRSLLGEHCGLAALLSRDVANVHADATQIEQVLINLVVNARDAMPDNGLLTIETSNSTMPADSSIGAANRAAVLLRVSDTGLGMTPEVRSKIFEPFFTTKSESGGTGLGLSTVYGIVKQSGGSIQVESEPGEGTSFSIFFPATFEAADTDLAETAVTPIPLTRARVLVVDDEAIVRSVVRRILEKNGYDVSEANSAEDALWMLLGHKIEADLIMTDLSMPGINGRELAHRLRDEFPKLGILFMSGYPDAVELGEGASSVGPLLQKPFDSRQLLEAVGKALAAAG
jgi:PAS domain S-box